MALIRIRRQADGGEDSAAAGVAEDVTRLAGDAFAALETWLNYAFFQLGDIEITAWLLLRVIVIVIAVYVISGLIRRGITRVGARRPNLNPSSVYTLSRLVH